MSATMLKMIAMITMLIDHVGAALFSLQLQGIYIFQETFNAYILRGIGRAAMPIFAFLIVEGFKNTKSVKKYMARLLIFAVISEIPYNMFSNAISGMPIGFSSDIFFMQNVQNIYFTWLISVLSIYFIDRMKNVSFIFKIVNGIIVISLLFASEILKVDYGSTAVLLVIGIYLTYPKDVAKKRFMQMIVMICGIAPMYSGFPEYFKFFACLGGYLIFFYNGRQTSYLVKKNKYLFYAFYPAHLLIISLIVIYI